MKKYSKINFFIGAKIFVLSVLVLLHFFQVTEMTKNLYKIQSYNREIRSIHEKSRRAEYGFLKSNSISRTEELIETNDFVRVENVDYINLPDFEMALR